VSSVIHLLGDGLAGTLLARELDGRGLAFRQYGDGATNTPPVGFVHLFQGRTFHRDPLEVEVFKKAIEVWSAEPLAVERPVVRTVKKGDRLYRSASSDTVPAEFRPHLLSEDEGEGVRYGYGPGFVVAAGELLKRTQEESGRVLGPRVDHIILDGVVIHACGLDIENLLPSYRWDTNPGRTVEAHAEASSEVQVRSLILHQGCHLGSAVQQSGFTVGGRVSSKGEAKNDEQRIAASLLGCRVSVSSQWWGKRIANALDRWPLIGWLNRRDFAFAGFGGRALFWLPYCVELAAEALREGHNEGIPERLRADRFGERE